MLLMLLGNEYQDRRAVVVIVGSLVIESTRNQFDSCSHCYHYYYHRASSGELAFSGKHLQPQCGSGWRLSPFRAHMIMGPQPAELWCAKQGFRRSHSGDFLSFLELLLLCIFVSCLIIHPGVGLNTWPAPRIDERKDAN